MPLMRPLLLIAFLGSVSMTAPAHAGNWCGEGTGKAMIGAGGTKAVIDDIRKACKPGDTIGIPGNSSFVIGTICDFTKSIFRSPDGLAICVVSGK